MIQPLIITAQMLRWQVTCERRIWLDEHGSPAERTAPDVGTLHLIHQGVQHEQAVHEVTTPHATSVPVKNWSEAVQLTADTIRHGERGLLGATLQADVHLDGLPPAQVRGKIDYLGLSRSGNYVPIEIKRRQRLMVADQIQMEAYIWLLRHLQSLTNSGVFWLGRGANGLPLEVIEHEYDESRLMQALRRVVELCVTAENNPSVRLAPHCRMCHWQDHCNAVARNDYSLSLLNGLPKKTIGLMKRQGIRSLHDVVKLEPDDLKRVKGIKTTSGRHHAHACAWVENRPIRFAEVHPACNQDVWFFDIETVVGGENQDTVWSIGWCKGDRQTVAIMVAPDDAMHTLTLPNGHHIHMVENYHSAWQLFEEIVSTDDEPLFHWSGFDASNMKKFAPATYGRLQHRLFDLSRLFTNTVQIPRKGISLKVVAPYFGFEWRGYDFWWDAWQDYKRWLNTRVDKELMSLSAYQADDVLAMVVIRDWLIQSELSS